MHGRSARRRPWPQRARVGSSPARSPAEPSPCLSQRRNGKTRGPKGACYDHVKLQPVHTTATAASTASRRSGDIPENWPTPRRALLTSGERPDSRGAVAVTVLLERQRPFDRRIDLLPWIQSLVAIELDRREVNERAARHLI